jgi:hypothetical protein
MQDLLRVLETDGSITQEEGWYSPEYGLKIKASILQIHRYTYLKIYP